MRNKIYLQIPALFFFLSGAVVPAFATKTSTALAICISRGPDCSVTNKGDDYQICVNNTNGRQCVNCGNLAQPTDKQTCSVARVGKPGSHVGVAGLLADEQAEKSADDPGTSKQGGKPY
jgi:hypothetical protein